MSFGTDTDKAASNVRVLDDTLIATGEAGTKAAAGVDRAAKATTASAAAADKAAAAQRQHALALKQVETLMAGVAAESPKVQQATLRQAAAQERYNALQESGTATTRQLASAQAGLIGATRSLAAAQEEGAVAGGRFRTSMTGMLKTAGELGLLIGVVEGVKKAFEFIGAGKDLTTALNGVQAASRATDEQMKAVRAEAIALGKDLTVPAATAVDAAEAIEDLVKAGVALPRALAAARPALLLAAAANVSTADSARVLGDVLDEFQLDASKAGEVANYLAAGANAAGGGLMDMFQAFTYIGPRGRAVGLGVADIAAAITDLAKAGITADRAGTGLAMMLQKIAHESAPGKKALDDLGVSAWDAAGKFVGLPKVIDQLHAAQQRLDPKTFLADISVAFGARASNVVAAFAGKGVESYNRFLAVIKSGDVQKYADLMNRGVAAGFRQLSKEATAAGISVYQKFEPAIGEAINGIGTTLPHAIGTLASILGPTFHVVGVVGTAAFHGLGVTVGVASTALSTMGGILSSNTRTVTDLATATLATLAAIKAVGIGVAVFKAIQTAAILSAVRVLELRDAFLAVAAGEKVASMAALGVATAGLGIAAYAAGRGLSDLFNTASAGVQVMQNLKSVQTDFASALNASNGALTESVRTTVGAQLQADGLAKKAFAAGISLTDLTDAVTGGDAAMAALIKRWQAAGDPNTNTTAALNLLGKQYQKSAGDAKDLASVNDTITAATNKSANAAKAAAAAQAAQKKASDALKASLQALAQTQLASAQSEDQFLESVMGVTTAVKQNGKSLSTHTAAGLANRDAFLSAVQAALSYKDAQTAAGAPIAKVTQTLADNVRQLEATAIKAGMSKTQVHALVAQMGLTPKQIGTKFDVDTSTAKAKMLALQAWINSLRATVHVSTSGATAGATGVSRVASARASGGGLPDGVSSVGEQGPELAIKHGSQVDILSNSQSRAYIAATGLVAPGFAGGTVNGTHYTTDLGYQNAKARAAIAAQKHTASQDLTYGNTIRTDTAKLGKLGLSPTSTRSDVSAQLGQTERDLRAAGIPKSFITGLANDNKKILDAVSARNNAAAHLALANQAVADAKNVKAQDVTAFKGAVTGTFDITSAGADATTGAVTGGGILAQQAQAVTRAKAFVTGLTALIGKKIFPAAYIRSLAGQGPGALGQVQALLSLSASQMQTLATENNTLNTLGGQIAGTAAGTLDDAAITTAKANQTLWKGREADRQKDVAKANKQLAKDIGTELHSLHLEATLGITKGQLAVIVETGRNQNKPRGKTSH